MRSVFLIFFAAVLCSCGASKTSNAQPASVDSSYGYAESNPVKVGGVGSGPANEREYLNSLSGPNGEQLSYYRAGSCCQFETKNSPWGMGSLDIYKVTYPGKKDTVTIYINMYDKEKLYAPAGFRFR